MKLTQLSQLLHINYHGPDAAFQSVSTDTRTLKPGALFIALVGPNFNANAFISSAAAKGAVAAIVSEPVSDSPLPVLQVADTRIALGQLAAHHRSQFNIPVIGLTGSCGKTTTKAMIASILQHCGPTLATEGTLNNDFGVPLTLLRLTPEHRYAVIEMGANHPGEIAYVTHIVKPTVAFINNAAPAHLEGFGSLQGVAQAKGEIFQGLAVDGAALINVEDPFSDYWQTLVSPRQIVRFGRKQPADVTATAVTLNEAGCATFQLITPAGKTDIQLQIMGEHNIMNALAAAAAAQAVGASLMAIKAGLEQFVPVNKRLAVRKGQGGAVIIDDSYNANPLSVTAAIQILAQKKGEKVLAFGDMRELGENAELYHQQIGETARQQGIDRLYAYGKLSACTVKAFGANGFHFDAQTDLIDALRPRLKPGVTVLVKGSLSMAMSKVVSALVEEK